MSSSPLFPIRIAIAAVNPAPTHCSPDDLVGRQGLNPELGKDELEVIGSLLRQPQPHLNAHKEDVNLEGVWQLVWVDGGLRT